MTKRNAVDLSEWVRTGERIALDVPQSGRFSLFVRRSGNASKPWVTFLHGFPTSSWDYAKVIPTLEDRFHLLAFDFLGFGFSDKPRAHRYRITEQADLTEALWGKLGVHRSSVVAHDYGTSVGQELLARAKERRLSCEITAIAFMNGGMYPHLHRALLIQKLLHHRLAGPIVTRLVTERTFRKNITKVYSSAHPPDPLELEQLWRAIIEKDGHRLYHRLIHYMSDRRENRARWADAVETTTVSLHFIWGHDDPISGKHVVDYLKERIPGAHFVELPGVGHYPQTEVPDVVARELAAAFVR